MSPDAITSMAQEPVKVEEVARDAPIVAEFVDYLRWLADQDTGYKISVGDLWQLWYDGVRRCVSWSEVCFDLGLPERGDWT